MKNALITDPVKIAGFFKTLADPTRVCIIKLLLKYNTLCVGRIAQELQISQPAVSQHLRILKNMDIVTGRRMGFHIHYEVNRDIFVQYGLKIELLTEGKTKCSHS